MTARVRYADVVPYDVPSSFSALRGPTSGVLTLPRDIHWGPRSAFDVDDPALRVVAYQAIVREGTSAAQEALLNAALLRQVWPQLALPVRCRALWEEHLPELCSSTLARPDVA